jgi:hypothetical protein
VASIFAVAVMRPVQRSIEALPQFQRASIKDGKYVPSPDMHKYFVPSRIEGESLRTPRLDLAPNRRPGQVSHVEREDPIRPVPSNVQEISFRIESQTVEVSVREAHYRRRGMQSHPQCQHRFPADDEDRQGRHNNGAGESGDDPA